MPRPTREPPAATSLPSALVRYVSAIGGDAALFASRFGLPGDVGQRDEIAVAPSLLGAMIDAASAIAGDASLALRLPRELASPRYGPVELAARASPTVRGALEAMARYAALIHPSIACAFEDAATEGRWHQATPRDPRGIGRHASEYALAFVLTLLRSASDCAVAATRVWFAHARPPDLVGLARFFGTEDLDFGATDSGFALPREVLDVALRGGDARLLATALPLAEAALHAQPRGQALASLAAARIEALLPGDAGIEAVARALSMSPRTLQRRLEDEGTRFSDVTDGVREKLARAWLRDESLSTTEIGYRLGFADLATFSRAFKRWTGTPPGTWRRSGSR